MSHEHTEAEVCELAQSIFVGMCANFPKGHKPEFVAAESLRFAEVFFNQHEQHKVEVAEAAETEKKAAAQAAANEKAEAAKEAADKKAATATAKPAKPSPKGMGTGSVPGG